MLRYGIPEFRLPKRSLNEEIDLHRAHRRRSPDRGEGRESMWQIEDLLKKHDAVLLAAGCYRSRATRPARRRSSGMYPGLEFMMRSRRQAAKVGNRVLVIGAGFTAFDCAPVRPSLGAQDRDHLPQTNGRGSGGHQRRVDRDKRQRALRSLLSCFPEESSGRNALKAWSCEDTRPVKKEGKARGRSCH